MNHYLMNFEFKLISWNVRGSGSVEKAASVWRLVRKHRLVIVVLQETKVDVFGLT